MLSGPIIIIVAFLYLCLLFAIAYYGDKRADQGRSLIANPYIYALSIAVYCTSWTFYGSVGRAASTRRRLPADLSRSDAYFHPGLVRDPQDHPHQQGQPHYLDRRFRRLALRQELPARRPRHRHRGGRHPSLHLAAAQGDLDQLFGAVALSRDRDADHLGEPAVPAGHGAFTWR